MEATNTVEKANFYCSLYMHVQDFLLTLEDAPTSNQLHKTISCQGKWKACASVVHRRPALQPPCTRLCQNRSIHFQIRSIKVEHDQIRSVRWSWFVLKKLAKKNSEIELLLYFRRISRQHCNLPIISRPRSCLKLCWWIWAQWSKNEAVFSSRTDVVHTPKMGISLSIKRSIQILISGSTQGFLAWLGLFQNPETHPWFQIIDCSRWINDPS